MHTVAWAAFLCSLLCVQREVECSVAGSNSGSVEVHLREDLGARVVRRTALYYKTGPSDALDRSAHMRAGSALVRIAADKLAIVQDDSLFIGTIDVGEHTHLAYDIALPSLSGQRLFDDKRGNKKLKLDLEAGILLNSDGTDVLLALGSGSSSKRERIALITNPASDHPHVTMVEARELYKRLRDARECSGSELNIEGAAESGDDIVLFQRGNGAPEKVVNADGTTTIIPAVDSTVRVKTRELLAYLHGLPPILDTTHYPRTAGPGAGAPCPALEHIVQWKLGAVAGGTRLTFTDGVAGRSGGLAFLASAEDCPDAVQDGPVTGVVIGRVDDANRIAELGDVMAEDGTRLVDKAEGLAFDSHDARRAWLVVDKDDPSLPAELLELELGPAWAEDYNDDQDQEADEAGGFHDHDGDGVPDHRDCDADNDGIANHHDSDVDGDGVPDHQEL